MRGFGILAGLLLGLLAAAPEVYADKSALEALAPTGRLRVALQVTNPVLVSRDSGPAEIFGVAPDLARTLADRLRVPFQPIRYATVPQLLDGIAADAWDVTFLTIDPERAKRVDFTPPYLLVENSIVVPPGSRVQSSGSLEMPGVRIAVVDGSSNSLALSRKLKEPQFVRGSSSDGLLEFLRTGQADVFADNRPFAMRIAKQLPGARILQNGAGTGLYGMAVPKGNAVGLKYLTDFLEREKRSGLVEYVVARARLQGVTVAQSR